MPRKGRDGVLRLLTLVILLWGGATATAAPWIYDPGQTTRLQNESFHYLCSEKTLEWTQLVGRSEGWLPAVRQDLGMRDNEECWSLITVDNRSLQTERAFLQHGLSMTSRLDLYHLVAGRLVQAESLGMDVPFKATTIDYRLPVFDLKLAPGENVLLIRQSSRDVFVLDWQLYNPEAFYRDIVPELLLYGGFFAICFALSFYNLVISFVNREISQVYYFFYLNLYGLAQLYLTGFLKQLIFPGLGMALNQFGIITINAALYVTVYFIYYFLDFQKEKTLFTRILNSYVLLLPLPIVFCLTGHIPLAAHLTQIVSLTASGLAIAAAFIALRKRHPLARFFMLAWSLLIVGNALQVLHMMAILPDKPWIVSINFIGASFEATIISYALAHKMRFARLQEAQRRRHAFSQLEKMVYPHQMEQMKTGGILEATMPHASGEALVICLDIIASTSSHIEDLPNFLRRFFDRCGELMNRDYQGDPLSASGFRIKELGDGFLCSVGFPFQVPPGRVDQDVALQLAFGFLDAFDHEFARTVSKARTYCSIGLARGVIQGFFPVSGIRSYELFGDAVVLATRYESLRKQWPASRQGHIITMPSRMYETLPAHIQPLFQKHSLSPGSGSIRNDAEANAFYRGIFEAGEAQRILDEAKAVTTVEMAS